MSTVAIVFLIAALVSIACTIAAAINKLPLWIAVLILCLIFLFQALVSK
jgi:hypothetical protein